MIDCTVFNQVRSVFEKDPIEGQRVSKHMLHSDKTAERYYDEAERIDHGARSRKIITNVLREERLTEDDLLEPSASKFLIIIATNTCVIDEVELHVIFTCTSDKS